MEVEAAEGQGPAHCTWLFLQWLYPEGDSLNTELGEERGTGGLTPSFGVVAGPIQQSLITWLLQVAAQLLPCFHWDAVFLAWE